MSTQKMRKIVILILFVLSIVLTTIILNLYLPDDFQKISGNINNTGTKIKVSILGDSISTYDGYSPHDYFPFYPSGEVNSVDKTWWYKFLREMNYELGFNSSWGGTPIACTSVDDVKCFSSDQRINDLGRNGTPDYIIIHGGTNDLVLSQIGSFSNTSDVTTFIGSYYTVIKKIRNRYPNTEIIAVIPTGRCGVPMSKWTGENGFYNVTKKILENNNIRYIDLNNTVIFKDNDTCTTNPSSFSNYYLPDKLHPNIAGQEVIKNEVVKEFKNRITVKYNKNDNTGGQVSQVFKIGLTNQAFGKNTNGTYIWGNAGQFGAWDRTGYKLLGWSTNPNATTAQWSVYSGVSDSWISQNSPKVNLYAVWQPKTVDVTYHINYGNDALATQKFTVGIKGQKFGKITGTDTPIWGTGGQFSKWDRTDYKLLGWSTNPKATTAQWSVYSDVIDDWINRNEPNIHLYAVWQPKTVDVTYHINYGNDALAIQKFTVGTKGQKFGKITGTDTPIWGTGGQFSKWDRTGYKLLGWSTNPKATTAQWSVYSDVIDDWIKNHGPKVNLYAVWQLRTINVTYDKNDGTNATAHQKFTLGVRNQKFGKITGTDTSIWGESGQFSKWDRKNYKLLGWSTNPKATTAQFSVYSGVSDRWINKYGPNIHLYAVWQKEYGIPTCKTKIYNGKTQTLFAEHTTTNGYTNIALKKKNVGSYTVTLRLTNGNYWRDNTSTDKVLTCKIVKATPTITLKEKIAEYNGSPISANQAVIVPFVDNVKYTYYKDSACTKGATTTPPTKIGQYYVKASIKATSNTNAAKGKCISHKIVGHNIENAATNNITKQIYTGNEIKPEVIITIQNKVLNEGIDYSLNYINNINIGTATIKIIGKGNYGGEKIITFDIIKQKVSIPTCSTKTYNRQKQTLFEAHTTGAYINNELSETNAGDYTVSVTPTSNYEWSDGTTETKNITCTINPYNITDADVVPISDYTYDGTAKEPVPSVLVNDTILNSTDYDVTYTNNINAGEANVTITGKGNYTGTVNTTFAINKANGYVTLNKTNENVLYGTSSTTFDILTNSGEISVSDDNETATTSITGNTVTVNNISTLSTGTIIKVEVTSASNQNYKQAKISYTLKICNNPLKGGSVTIIGNNIVGSTLIAQESDTTPKGTYTYKWYRDDEELTNETLAVYTLTTNDIGKSIKVEVTATKENYDSITFEDTTDVTNNKTQTVKEGVTKPTNNICDNPAYTGGSQILATIPSGDSLKYGLINNSGIEIGSYTVIARLNEGYIWSNGDTADVILNCSIE